MSPGWGKVRAWALWIKFTAMRIAVRVLRLVCVMVFSWLSGWFV